MDWLLPLAAKSFILAAVVLLVLRLAARRSAFDRSTIAHAALVALLLLPAGAMLLPRLEIQTALLGETVAAEGVPQGEFSASEVAPPLSFPAAHAPLALAEPVRWSLALYAVPAALLLLLTLIALLRLWALKARAEVVVDPHWLSALARAQHRMGMKNGTALLVSRDLHSPISWGLLRPVILLNEEALSATREAEAIIAHELAHVARLDWAKLLLARVATALFWFNPLVWLLAREAHQLREEAADDAVLAADVENTDYAELLVGIARHECRGLLIGAHGVAPGPNSLKRRVSRVLDGTLARTPVSRAWFAGFACGAFATATPLAALTLVPTEVKPPRDSVGGARVQASAGRAGTAPVATASTIAAVPPAPALALASSTHPVREPSPVAAPSRRDPMEVPEVPDVEVDVDVDVDADFDEDAEIDPVALRAVGVTAAYAEAIARAAPQLPRPSVGTLHAFKSSGVTAGFLRDLRAAGYGSASRNQIIAAAVHGVDGAYLRAMQAQGVRASLEKMTELRVIGVTPRFVERLRQRHVRALTPDRLIEYRAVGLHPEDVPHGR